jgi:hypothetical protein
MKHFARAMVVLGFLSLVPVAALAQEPAMVTCKDGSTSKAGKGACSHHGGVAKGGAAAPAPAPRNDNAAPPPPSTQRSAPAPSRSTTGGATGKPTAQCKDGTTSYSAHHSGACSHHGGVKQWLDGTQ